MSSAVGQGAFRIGVFILLTSGVLLLFLERDTAEFVLMVFMFVLAIIFLASVTVIVRVLPRR